MAGGLMRRLFGGRSTPEDVDPVVTTTAPTYMLHGGNTLYPVVGESNYQKALGKLAGRLSHDGPERRDIIANLVAEPSNAYDARAIRVESAGKLIGYIPRDATEKYHPFLSWAANQGRGVQCRASIDGGFIDDSGRRAHLGVKLSLTLPPLIAYDGAPPTIDRPTGGGRVSVTGEEPHQDRLLDLVYRLHLAELALDETGRVRVSIDGTEVGSLTKKMSERYGPPIERDRIELGRPPTCLACVLPGSSKLEVSLQLPTNEHFAVWAKII